MIFKGVREGKPYPDHGLSARGWAKIPPRQFRLNELTTVTTVLALDRLLSEDSTFYGDLFSHVVRWHGELYLEDGLHRAVRSALRNRHIIHARMLDLDALDLDLDPEAPPVEDQVDTAELPSPGRESAGGVHRRGARSTGWTVPVAGRQPPEW
ncbi:type II toxin-antitoxin system VapB family antitoxin [Gordonia hankookensis]|uniref:Type II toxin-antitoxin system VapB family antitoxin n=1 Tax=Gordonia hankookensis TaxID=589403 RepID=A0ABR7W5Z4_9ACTN|nr:type II toxin-antitoxin system VapB family antitoxin [Gordonia hankookensis]MBD1318246.1 type II toxin-antitoxin system VapB family antitoxin [Gordonia hankookensis]NDZ93782.1 type II toxin-antitoxin system VapB family antitoxin [Streptomyces sp. SID11726]NEB25568.1 type II toxin-antitoxin system VapB family antitoxin [Streptomyces sp. SID6673]